MANITYGSRRWSIAEGSNLLGAMLEEGIALSHGCKSGVCRSCLVVAVEGDIPEAAQVGLSAAERKQRLLLACQCAPRGDLVLADAGERLDLPAEVVAVHRLCERVAHVQVRVEGSLDFTPGQFLNLVRPDGLSRSYSIASLPDEGTVDFHVGLVPEGRMSGWLLRDASPGDRVVLRGPYGKCCYDRESTTPQEPLVLAGTGTGLAPLWGIARDALRHGHSGPITLYHGGLNTEALYWDAPLRRLADAYANFRYLPHVLEGEPPPGGRCGPINDAVLRADVPPETPLTHSTVYLCGAPEFVNRLRRNLFLSGCSLAKIHADAFVMAPPPSPPASSR